MCHGGRAAMGPHVCFCVQCVIVCLGTHPGSLLSYSLLTGIRTANGWGLLEVISPQHGPQGTLRLRFLCALQVLAGPVGNPKHSSGRGEYRVRCWQRGEVPAILIDSPWVGESQSPPEEVEMPHPLSCLHGDSYLTARSPGPCWPPRFHVLRLVRQGSSVSSSW